MKSWSEMLEVQPLASKIITNSIRKNRISHAYLLQGARGTGKKAIAKLLAKTLFCDNRSDVEPCQQCVMCRRIDSGNHPDVHWIEPDGQSIKTHQIESLQKEFAYSGVESNQKFYVINGADTLTVNAANRILKFLEEPSQQTTAVMLTENSQSILPTIRSRCQVIDLKPLNPVLFQKQLMDAGMSQTNAKLISTLTNDFTEAFRLSKDEWFVQARKIVVQLLEMLARNTDDAYLFIHQYWLPSFKEKSEQQQGIDLLLLAFRDILYFHIEKEDRFVFFQQGDERLEKLAIHFSQENLITILQKLLEAKRKIKQNVQPTLVMEQLILEI